MGTPVSQEVLELSFVPRVEHHFDCFPSLCELYPFVDTFQRKDMGNEFFRREGRGNSKLERPLGLAVRGAKVPFNPNVVIVD